MGGLPIRSQADLTAIFESLAEHLKSAQCKLAPVKTSRWFSWHDSCHVQMREWFALRMMLLWEFPNEVIVDDTSKGWAALRSDSGGLKLALHCTTWRTWLSVNVLYIGGQPLWNWYSNLVRTIKSPEQGLGRLISLALNKWQKAEEVMELVAIFSNREQFERIQKYLALSQRHLGPVTTCDMASFVEELFHYVLGLVERRSSSLSKYSCPPEMYSPLLSANEEDAQTTLDVLMGDWQSFLKVQQSSGNQLLSADLQSSVDPPVRLVYQLCEVGRHDAAKRILRSLLHVLPDTKFIEDIHGKVRNDARLNANKRQTFAQIQQVVRDSDAFESRGIHHPAKVDKSVFQNRWKRTKGSQSWKASFVPKTEKLPKKYGSMLGTKWWNTISEESLHRSSAAWELLRFHTKHSIASKLNDTWLGWVGDIFFSD